MVILAILHLLVQHQAPALWIGVADVDGSRTAIGVADGALRTVCTVEHRRGFVPKGVIVDDGHIALTLAESSGRDAAVVVLDLKTCQMRTLFDEAIPLQAPLLVGDRIVAVREIDAQKDGALFEVVAAQISAKVSGGPTVLTQRRALWVTPVRGATSEAGLRFLVAEGAGPADGTFHIDHLLQGGDLEADLFLGAGVFRSPVLTAKGVVLEEEREKHGVIIDGNGQPLHIGLAGMSPVSDGVHVAWGNGSKNGGIVIDGVARAGVRAGVAQPQFINDDGVAVWLDRGQSLPGELWWLPTSPATAPRQLLPAADRTAVVVYGAAPTAAPKKATTTKATTTKAAP
jgi:hypothetical protein